MLTERPNESGRVTIQVVLSVGMGALLLSLLSMFQKYIIGADPFAPRGFIIPVLFGGGSGGVVGFYVARVQLLNRRMKHRIHELEALNQKINRLETLLPICSNCKKIRVEDGDPDRQGDWESMETYISERTSSTFTHGICPECREKLYGDELEDD